MSDAPSTPRIVIHAPEHADAALAAAAEAGRPVILQSPPACALVQGAAWFRTLTEAALARRPDAEALPVLDCGDAPGLALAALRDGAPAVRLSGHPDAREAVADIAMQMGARFDTAPLSPRHDLLDSPDPHAACRRFLALDDDAGGTPAAPPP